MNADVTNIIMTQLDGSSINHLSQASKGLNKLVENTSKEMLPTTIFSEKNLKSNFIY